MTGAEQTFIALYEEHFDDVNRFCLRRVARADVDDAVADVFAVVWKRVDEFDPDAGRA